MSDFNPLRVNVLVALLYDASFSHFGLVQLLVVLSETLKKNPGNAGGLTMNL